MKLYYAKMSTYCQKVMIAFKEKEQTFTPMIINMMDPVEREKFAKISPFGKIPALELNDGTLLPESTSIIEFLDDTFTTGTKLIPADKEKARAVRHWDRLFDLYLNESIAMIFFDGIQPENMRNPEGVKQAKAKLETIYALMDKELSKHTWAAGESFSLADCSAYAPLFYAKQIAPFHAYKNVTSYFGRLAERKSAHEVMLEVLPELKKFEESRKS